MALLLALWYVPPIKSMILSMDESVALFFNGALSNRFFASFCATMNHESEKLLNIVVLLSFNLAYVFSLRGKSRLRALAYTLFLWVYLQLVAGGTNYLLNHVIPCDRASPSLAIEGFTRLSELFNNPKIKDAAARSFPSGHSLAMVYWLLFSARFASRRFVLIGIFPVLLFSLPRMFAGAHWLSDTVFSVFMADFFLIIIFCSPAHKKVLAWIEKGLLSIRAIFIKDAALN